MPVYRANRWFIGDRGRSKRLGKLQPETRIRKLVSRASLKIRVAIISVERSTVNRDRGWNKSNVFTVASRFLRFAIFYPTEG